MTLPSPELLSSAKRLGEAWANAPDKEYQDAISAAVTEGITGSPPEPPDPPDPPVGEPDVPTPMTSWKRGSVIFDFGGKLTDVYLSATGDPLVIGPVEVRAEGLKTAEDRPSPKNKWRTGLVVDDEETEYDAKLNPTSLSLPAGSRRLAAVELPAATRRPRLSQAEVLTSARVAPPKGFFRPPYVGPDGDVKYSISNILWDRLPQVEAVGTPTKQVFIGGGSSGRVLVNVEKYWSGSGLKLDHMPDWPGRELHPLKNMAMDGKDICDAVGVASLLSMTKGIPDTIKHPCVYGLIQYGIDLFGIVKDGGHANWVCGGQHGMGRLWPILYAGILLDNEEMQNVMFRTPRVAFNEIDQTFIVTQEDVALGFGGYLTSDIGKPDWGNQHGKPYGPPGTLIGRAQDDKRWVFTAAEQTAESAKWAHVKYRKDTWPHVWGWVLSAQLMGAEHLINHAPLFEYSDRYFSIEQGTNATHQWPVQMWERHRV